MKFLADGMLGKLARWLRILGYDVQYVKDKEDAELLDTAKNEKRVLLTRDFELYMQAVGRSIETYYLEGQTTPEKLAELVTRFGISLRVNMTVSRCPKCNALVKQVPKNEIKGKVKTNTLKRYQEFWVCPNCGQVYWQGAHWNKITKTLTQAKQLVEQQQQ